MMKIYKYIGIIWTLTLWTLFFTACSKEEIAPKVDIVEVSFCTEFPKPMSTRAANLDGYKVYCAVFENDVEITSLRTAINVVAGQPIVFTPRLVKGRTYNVAFWASKEGAYNVSDMTAIAPTLTSAGITGADYDAFTATTTLTAEGNHSQKITLYRPLAQLNMGVTEADWNTVTDTAKTPTTIKLTIKDVKTSFNALSGNAFGSTYADITHTLNITGDEFSVDGNTYKNIAQCYVLMPTPKQYDSSAFNITYSIYDQNQDAIQENASLIHIPLQANYKTNVVGALLTGVATYTITEDNSNDDNNN